MNENYSLNAKSSNMLKLLKNAKKKKPLNEIFSPSFIEKEAPHFTCNVYLLLFASKMQNGIVPFYALAEI